MTVAIPTQQTILDEPIEFGAYQVFVTDQPMLDIRLREDGLGMWNLPIKQVHAYREAVMALKVAHEAIIATLRRTRQHVPYGVPDTLAPMNDDIDIHSEIALQDALSGVDLTRMDGFRPDEPPLFIDTVIHPVKLCGTHLHFLPNAYPQEYECYATNCTDISSGPCTLPIGHDGSCPIDLTGDATEDCPAEGVTLTQDSAYATCNSCGTVLEVDDDGVDLDVAPHSRLKPEEAPRPRLMKTLRRPASRTADDPTKLTPVPGEGAPELEPVPMMPPEPRVDEPSEDQPTEEDVPVDSLLGLMDARDFDLIGHGVTSVVDEAIVIHPLKSEEAATAARTVLFNVTHAAYATPWRYTTGLSDPYVNLQMRQVGVQPFIPTWTGDGRLIVEVVEHDGHNSDDARFAGMSRKVMQVVTQIEARLADVTEQEASDIAYPHPAPALATKTAGRTIVKSTKPTTRKNSTTK